MSGNFPVHVSAESPSNNSPNPSEVISEALEPFGQLLKFSKKIVEEGQLELYKGSETLDMSIEQLGEMFEGDSADMCTGKFLIKAMGGQANRQLCADGE